MKFGLLLSALYLFNNLSPISYQQSNNNDITENTVFIRGDNIVNENNLYSYEVLASSFENVSTLSLSIFYDPVIFEISNIYNYVDCTLVDHHLNDNQLNISYIFDSFTSETEVVLFSFECLIKPESISTSGTLDIAVSDCYNDDFEIVHYHGKQFKVNIIREKDVRDVGIIPGIENEGKIDGNVKITYFLTHNLVTNGEIKILYDSELLTFENITFGSFFDDMIYDYNVFNGEIYISFVSDKETAYNYDFFSVEFKISKNIDAKTDVTLKAIHFFDYELNEYICEDAVANIDITYDPYYRENIPTMYLSYEKEENNIYLKVNLSENSTLGAGDFTITYDSTVLTFVDYDKKFSPSFFNVNTRKIDEGIVKFSIISLTDITYGGEILEISFTSKSCLDKTIEVGLTAKGVTNSLTEFLYMELVPVSVEITANSSHVFGNYEPNGSEIHVAYCIYCGLRVSSFCEFEVVEVEGSCGEEGKIVSECKDCGNRLTQYMIIEHNLVQDEINNTSKYTRIYCTNCDHEEITPILLIYPSYLKYTENEFIQCLDEYTDFYLFEGETLFFEYDNTQIKVNGEDNRLFLHTDGQVNDYAFTSTVTGMYTIRKNDIYQQFAIENSYETHTPFIEERAQIFIEKLKNNTENVTICGQNGVLDDKFAPLAHIVKEYLLYTEEMKQLIDFEICFGHYTCYEVLEIVVRGLNKTGRFDVPESFSKNILLHRVYDQPIGSLIMVLVVCISVFIFIYILFKKVIRKRN